MIRTEVPLWIGLALVCGLLVTAAAKPVRRAPGHPSPRASVNLNVGDTVIVGGQSFIVSYGLTPVNSIPVPPVPTLVSFTTNGPSFAGGSVVNGLLTLSAAAPTGGLSISLTSSAPAVLAPPSVVTVAPGATSTSFTATASSPTATTPVILNASVAGISLSATVTILGSAPPALTSIYGFRNGNRDWTNRFSPGQTILIEGVGFGTLPGVVQVGGAPVNSGPPDLPKMFSKSPDAVLSSLRPEAGAWSDQEIIIVCPAAAAPVTPSLTLILATGQVYHSGLQFTISPTPAARKRGK